MEPNFSSKLIFNFHGDETKREVDLMKLSEYQTTDNRVRLNKRSIGPSLTEFPESSIMVMSHLLSFLLRRTAETEYLIRAKIR